MTYECTRIVTVSIVSCFLGCSVLACVSLKSPDDRPSGSSQPQGGSNASGGTTAGADSSGAAAPGEIFSGIENGGTSCPALAASAGVVDCSADNVFCDDFAPRSDLEAASGNKRWSLVEAKNRWTDDGATTVALDSESPRDGGPALHLHLSGEQESGRYGPFIEDLATDLAVTSGSKLSMSFDFLSEGQGVYPWGFECGAGGGKDRYRLALNLDGNKMTEQLDDTDYREFEDETNIDPDPTYFNEWKHFDLILDRAASTFTMCIDGEVVFPAVELHGDLTRDSEDMACEFRLIYFAEAGIQWDGYYKNLKMVREL
jgi:hypothetical protein